jgi:hypothetical protein
MIELDYVLYDNQRPSILFGIDLGIDFGIRAPSGFLRQRRSRPLRAAFRQYCRLTQGDHAHPSDFGSALGGLRPAAGPGYLLCITLETRARGEQRGVAVVGLWCPDRDVLRSVIRDGDPFRAARLILGETRLPKMLTVAPAAGRAGRPLWTPDDTVYVRFARYESIEIAAGLILGTPADDPLPSILGITPTSRFGAAAKSGFDVVFVKPMHEATEQVLTRLETLPAALSGDMPIVVSAARSRGRNRFRHDRAADASRSWPRGWLFAGLALSGSLAVAIFAAWWLVAHRQSPLDPRPDSRPGSRPDSVQASLRAIADLDVDLLQKSPGYIAAEQVPVVAARDAARARVRDAYATLIDRRRQLVLGARPEHVDKGITVDALEACGVLREAFLAELTADGSIAGAWCRTVASLNASLTNPD